MFKSRIYVLTFFLVIMISSVCFANDDLVFNRNNWVCIQAKKGISNTFLDTTRVIMHEKGKDSYLDYWVEVVDYGGGNGSADCGGNGKNGYSRLIHMYLLIAPEDDRCYKVLEQTYFNSVLTPTNNGNHLDYYSTTDIYGDVNIWKYSTSYLLTEELSSVKEWAKKNSNKVIIIR